MENFFQYPTYSSEDRKWGLVLNTLGYTHIPRNSAYPLLRHPKSYQFSPSQTRIVDEYQIIYITDGNGLFEAEDGVKKRVVSGTIFILFPNVAHRYRPAKATGWTEYYVGVSGPLIDNLLKTGFLSAKDPVHEIGLQEHMVQHYQKIFQLAQDGKAGWQQAASSTAFHLLGDLQYLLKNQTIDTATERLIQRIRIQINERIAEKINWEDLSKLNGVSYSKMRKEFKSYMGMTLGEYHSQLRINQAKLLLSQSQQPIKQIALSLGFQNEHYFNTVFKKMIGQTPGLFRKNLS